MSIAKLGERAGRKFNFDVQLSDTMDSWRLALWAEQQGQGEELLSAIGRRYFEEGSQLADHAMLISAVKEVGMDTTVAQGVLDSDAFRGEVMHHYQWASEQQGIHSIPVFIISDPDGSFRTVVHGSASIDEFVSVFKKAFADHNSNCTAGA